MFLNTYLCDIDNEEKGAWLHFPVTIGDIQKALYHAEISDYEYKFSAYESDIDSLTKHLTEYEDITNLSRHVEIVGAFTPYERDKYQALLQAKEINGIDGLIRYALAVNNYGLLPTVLTAEDLGRFNVAENKNYAAPDTVKPYIKYQALGEKIQSDEGGYLTKFGYLLPKKESED